MKNKKKNKISLIISLLLVAAMVVSIFPLAAFAEDSSGSDVQTPIVEITDDEAQEDETEEDETQEDETVDELEEGEYIFKKVTTAEIEDGAFFDCHSLESITISKKFENKLSDIFGEPLEKVKDNVEINIL